MTGKNIFVIAGEPSGDVIGAGLIRELKAQGAGHISGIGGELMQVEGLETLMPMKELCVMGIWEVIWQLPRLIKLIDAVVYEIETRAPDVVVTIDLPDFNFQVAKKLKLRGIFKGKLVHYVAPSVWAWRPKRAEKIAQFYDGLLCLFPFEPPYFTKHGLKAEYVGHPITEQDFTAMDGHYFRRINNIPAGAPTLGLFLGSRPSEIYKMAPVFIETVNMMKETMPELEIIVPTLSDVEFDVLHVMRDCKHHVTVTANPELKWHAFAACDVGLAVSGTVGLELAYLGMPHIIGYKMHPVTWLAVQKLVKIKYAHLGNILLDAPLVPEFLQYGCTSMNMAREIMTLLKNKDAAQKQRDGFATIKAMLGHAPSSKAAAFVLAV